ASCAPHSFPTRALPIFSATSAILTPPASRLVVSGDSPRARGVEGFTGWSHRVRDLRAATSSGIRRGYPRAVGRSPSRLIRPRDRSEEHTSELQSRENLV